MKILVIRTDNIGDLVCTTPLLTALRGRYPDAWIGVLANSYSAPVLYGHPAIDEVFEYSKAKHLDGDRSVLASYWQRLRTILRLRAMSLDLVLIPSVAGQKSALRFARWLGASRVVVNEDSEARHEVEKVYAIDRFLPDSLSFPPPSCSVVAQPSAVAELVSRLALPTQARRKVRVGLHISARKPSQRWPAGSFVRLARQLVSRYPDLEFLLFWSPGSADDAKHPGDDEKAQEIMATLAGDLPIYPVETHRLQELVAGLSLCDVVVLSDGGAMHVAAALGKPIVCFFGQSAVDRWRPWGVSHVVLQDESLQVDRLRVDMVVDAFASLVPPLIVVDAN